MQSTTDNPAPLPRVTFIIPVLNAAGILENCLQSIRRQYYPQENFEIIVGDAGSKDGTRELAKTFGALIVDDHGRNIEDGKRAALVHATGEYIVFIDADNEITHPDYIRRAVEALAANPTAFGVESYYLPSPRMTSFCSYLTCLLHISDPVAWLMSIKPVFLGAVGEVERWTFPINSLAYPVGSNGFVFRKSELDLVKAGENYSDTHTSVNLIQVTGKREWLRIKGRGVHHYYVATLGEFLKKRRRATCHFLEMQKEHGFSWTERKPRIPGWLACLLSATFIFPILQMVIALAKSRDARWFWHPWASFASALGVLWGLQTYAFAAKDKKLIHSLQPRQKLEAKIVTTPAASPKRIYFFANGVFSDQISGGDIHFFHMALAAMDAGYIVHFFGGHALEKQLRARFKHFELTLTDRAQARPFNANSFFGQFRLLFDYGCRLLGSLRQLSKIQPQETVYAVSDYWFDVWPVLSCKARKKMMIFHMDAPTMREIIFRSRSDVSASRITSVYYWLSQNFSLRMFRRIGSKRIFYVHPDMRPRLLRFGFCNSEIVYVSSGMNWKTASQVPPQKKEYDVIWLGRMHRQKGIEDLLETLVMLSKEVKCFRAILVGRLDELFSRLKELNLTSCVTLSGLVTEEEKFRLLKASRVFLMPSRQESWGIVIAEALACEVPVVAYDLPAYRPIFGSLIDYVPPFDPKLFKNRSLEAVRKTRRGENNLDTEELASLKEEHSLEAAGKRFSAAARDF